MKHILRYCLLLFLITFFCSLWIPRLRYMSERSRLSSDIVESAEFRQQTVDQGTAGLIRDMDSPGEYLAVYWLESRFGERSINLSPDDALLRGASRPFSGCGAGLCSIGIDSAGNVRGCESMYDERFNEGNLRQRRLTDIWNDPDAFAYNRRFTPALLTGPCALCPNGPRCAAGCRSYNYFTTGRLYESPLCVSRPLP